MVVSFELITAFITVGKYIVPITIKVILAEYEWVVYVYVLNGQLRTGSVR